MLRSEQTKLSVHSLPYMVTGLQAAEDSFYLMVPINRVSVSTLSELLLCDYFPELGLFSCP